MAAATREMTLDGTLHGLAMKIGKIGGEHITFVITTHAEWDEIKLFNDEDVEVVLRAKQAKLPLGEGQNGAEPADPRQQGLPGTADPKGRAKKEPKGEHAPTD